MTTGFSNGIETTPTALPLLIAVTRSRYSTSSAIIRSMVAMVCVVSQDMPDVGTGRSLQTLGPKSLK
ncbi:hypothetical protein [Paracoccus yeei]|uniref:hypothetical protein n=1 Tax=Paracoccus yeei TaxID=147645 RepID=UPI0012FE2DA5|nr:hypothetical protein [Paracoccus yeei]